MWTILLKSICVTFNLSSAIRIGTRKSILPRARNKTVLCLANVVIWSQWHIVYTIALTNGFSFNYCQSAALCWIICSMKFKCSCYDNRWHTMALISKTNGTYFNCVQIYVYFHNHSIKKWNAFHFKETDGRLKCSNTCTQFRGKLFRFISARNFIEIISFCYVCQAAGRRSLSIIP
jgi:hypothetical protein